MMNGLIKQFFLYVDEVCPLFWIHFIRKKEDLQRLITPNFSVIYYAHRSFLLEILVKLSGYFCLLLLAYKMPAFHNPNTIVRAVR